RKILISVELDMIISMLVVRSIFGFLKGVLMGIAATLMAAAIMRINYYFRYSGNIDSFRSLRNWTIIGGLIGIVAGIIFNRLTLPKGSLQREMQLVSVVIVRILIVALSVMGAAVAVWYYYRVDYFPLKDDGPLALIVGFVFGMWDL